MSFSVPQKVLDDQRAFAVWEWNGTEWKVLWDRKTYSKYHMELQPEPEEKEGVYVLVDLYEYGYCNVMPLQHYLDKGRPVPSSLVAAGFDDKEWFRPAPDLVDPCVSRCEVCNEPATLSGFAILRVGGIELYQGVRRFACSEEHLKRLTPVTERQFLSPLHLTEYYHELSLQAANGIGYSEDSIRKMIQAAQNCIAGLEAALESIRVRTRNVNDACHRLVDVAGLDLKKDRQEGR